MNIYLFLSRGRITAVYTYLVIICSFGVSVVIWKVTTNHESKSLESITPCQYKTSPVYYNISTKEALPPHTGKVNKILFWSHWDRRFGEKRFRNDDLGCVHHKTTRKCEFSYYTEDLESANIVVVFFSDWAYWRKNYPKEIRPRNQLWIFYDNEAPPQVYHPNWLVGMTKPPLLKEWKGLFNLTMTYRIDSDVYAPYGIFVPKAIQNFKLDYDRLGDKAPIALLIMSNCIGRHSRRHDYTKALLEAGLRIEHIGSCSVFNRHIKSPLYKFCFTNATIPTNTAECYPKLSKRYAFYLSFENSICTDYVTEKFFRASQLDMIPVIINGGNMSAVAPKNSFINARDFQSPRHLVEYLHKVATNKTLYNSYFAWKPYYDVVDLIYEKAFSETLCMLCGKSEELLEKAVKTTMVVDDIEDWWVNKGNCTRGPSLEKLKQANDIFSKQNSVAIDQNKE